MFCQCNIDDIPHSHYSPSCVIVKIVTNKVGEHYKTVPQTKQIQTKELSF